MSTPNVTVQLEGSWSERDRLRLTLVARNLSVDGLIVPATATTTDGRVVSYDEIRKPDEDGLVTFPGVWPTVAADEEDPGDDVIAEPADCRYALAAVLLGTEQAVDYYDVLDTAGPVPVTDRPADAPTALSLPTTDSVVRTPSTAGFSIVDGDRLHHALGSIDTALAAGVTLGNTHTSEIADLQGAVDGVAPGAIPIGQANMTDWYTQLGTGTARMVVVGDSIATLAREDRALLSDYCARYGGTWNWTGSTDIGNGTGVDEWTGTGTLHGGAGTAAMAANGFVVQMANGNSRTFTPIEPHDGMSFLLRHGSGLGSLQVRCDGVLVDTLVTANATTSYSELHYVEAPDLDEHEWTITAVGTVWAEQSYTHAGTDMTSGIVVWGMAHSGISSVHVLDDSSFIDAITNIDPHAVVILHGTNEASGTITADLTALVGAVRTACPDAVVFLGTPYRSHAVTAADVAAVRALQTSLDTGRIDRHAVLGDVGAANDPESMSGDNIHPDDAGAQALELAAIAGTSGNTIGALVAWISKRWRLLRTAAVDVQHRHRPKGRIYIGNVEQLGYTALAGYDEGDEAGGASHQASLIVVPGQEMADFLTLAGIPVEGPGLVGGPGGATAASSQFTLDTGNARWVSSANLLITRTSAPTITLVDEDGTIGTIAGGRFAGDPAIALSSTRSLLACVDGGIGEATTFIQDKLTISVGDGQTAPLLSLLAPFAVPLVDVTAAGVMRLGGATGTPGTVEKLRVTDPTTVDNAATVILAAGAAARKPLVVQGHGSQTANLVEAQTSTGAIATRIGPDGGLGIVQPINAVVDTTYTLVLADLARLTTLSNGSAIALTVPADIFPTGAVIKIAQRGAGQVTIGGGSVTLRSASGLKLRAQYSAAELHHLGSNEWLVYGDTTA